MKTGKLSELVLERSVLKKIRNKRMEVISGAKTGMDAAVLNGRGELATAVSVSNSYGSHGDSSFFYWTEEGIKFSVCQTLHRAVNSIAAEGADPCAVLISMILPEDIEEPVIKKIMDCFEEGAEYLNIQIAGGHSEVSSHVSVPVFSVHALGYRREGILKPVGKKGLEGLDIVMAGEMALEGTAWMALCQREKLEQRFTKPYIENAAQSIKSFSVVKMSKAAVNHKAAVMHDISETGVFGALWELGEKMKSGMEVSLPMIPLRQETIELSEYLDINPYTMPSLGALLIVTEDGGGLVKEFERIEIKSAVIGKVMKNNDRVILNHGERRFIEQPR